MYEKRNKLSLLINKCFSYKYLSKQDLRGFDSYKYRAIDTSPLSNYVMHPAWNTLVKFIPNNVAPNLITFMGFILMVIDVLLLTYYDYDCTSSGKPANYIGPAYSMPGWVLTVCGIFLFIAYNLDGVDGKQARKIGVSGPLGEMFDHGLDSYIVFIIPYCLFSVFGKDEFSVSEFRGFLIVLSVTLNFYVSHCEKYNTGTLYLPWGYDVSMWVASLLLIIAGVYGPSWFKFYVFGRVSFTQALEVTIHATGLLTTLPVSVYNVFLANKNGTGKKYANSLKESIRPVMSMLVMNVVIIIWALKSPSGVLQLHPRAFLMLYGTMFSHISCRLIVSEMSDQRCELICGLNAPLLSGLVVSLLHPQIELFVLFALLGLVLLAHVHYGVCVVRQMCDYYKVNCFTVPNRVKVVN